MSITDLFRFGFINLWRRKTRTFLTALSMAIGVMCIACPPFLRPRGGLYRVARPAQSDRFGARRTTPLRA